ncbi:MAG: alpha/beta fold hydrolase [Aquihabitans sp.]
MRRLAAVLLALGLLTAVAACGGGSDDRPPPKNATTIRVDGTVVNAIMRPPSEPVTGSDDLVSVLFLHGQSYDSRIWDDRKILDPVAAAGWRAVSVDLPGYGDTPERKDGASNGAWLRKLIDELGGPGRVVVVSPSMSGTYSLSYLEEFPKDELLGFVPVAPVGIDDFERPKDAAPISTMAIWGSEDPSYTEARDAHLLAQMRAPEGSAQSQVIEGASHACYDDEPIEFTSILLSFLRSLDTRSS